MDRIITYQGLKYYAYSNDKLIKGDIKGICIDFFGLGCQAMYHEDTKVGIMMAEHNILFVVPYSNPWGWMNRQEIDLTDEILDVLFEHYNLREDIPIASTGGSMGGLCALVYTYYAKRTPTCCVANCPVCNLVHHFSERDDLPRTIYSAFANEEGYLFDVLARYSPMHLAVEMPKIKYAIFHCDEDKAVDIYAHSEQLAAIMWDYDLTYHVIKNRGHCDLGEEGYDLYYKTIIDFLIK